MITNWLTILQDTGSTIVDIFVLPGDFVLSQFAAQAPAVTMKLGIAGDGQSIILPAILSLVLWLMLAVVVAKIVRLWQNIVRIVSAMIRTVSFRILLAARNLKTGLVCKLRLLIPRRSLSADEISEVEFDDLDLAVLRSAAARGPGFTTSAPELADQLPLRPAQIQRRLDKLNNNKMLDYVIGSTEGFDNYSLSESGIAFLAMWQRNGRGS